MLLIFIQVKSKRDNLLSHPVVTSLLSHKWKSYGRVFYYGSLFLYLLFLCFFTGFILVSPPPFFVLNILDNGTIVWYEPGGQRWTESFSEPTLSMFSRNGYVIIIILACMHLGKEVCINAFFKLKESL